MNTGLHINRLSYARNGQYLFQHLELVLQHGQGLIIRGPNGSGKTTLLRVLSGLINPSEGKLNWKGQDLRQSRSAYHEALHFLGHQPGIKHKLTVKENLSYSQELAHQNPSDKSLEAILESVQLLAEQDKLAETLSAGQKRRLALARLLSSPKPLWILDEPFTNLDQDGQNWFSKQIAIHLKNRGLLILASHQALALSGSFQTLSLPGCTISSERFMKESAHDV